MALRGQLDGVFDGVLRGWAWDPAAPEQPQELDILVDGAPLVCRRAERPRADLREAGFGFEWPLPIEFQDGASHTLAIRLSNHYPPLTLDSLELVIPRRLHMLRGSLERVIRGQLTGWVWDQSRADAHVAVELLLEGVVVAHTTADRQRPDLSRARIGQGDHGFAFDLTRLGRAWRPGARVEARCRAATGDWVVGSLELPAPPEAPALRRPAAPIAAAPSPARFFLDAARDLEGKREFAAAARALDSGLAMHPDDFDLVSVRARVHFALQELDAAERLAQHALALRPGHPRPFTLLARVASATGRHAEAAEFWAGVPPGDAAYRERLAKRPKDLARLGRRAEAVSEMATALQLRPDDQEARRALAEASETAGALHLALSHWRQLALAGRDPAVAARRVAALEKRLAPPAPDPLPSPLRNPALRDWSGPLLLDQSEGAGHPAPGLILRGALRAAPVAPWERQPGELPGYGLWLETAAAGAEALFLLDGAMRAELVRGLRMGLEIEHLAGSAEAPFTLALAPVRGIGGRVLLARRTEPRPRLLRFDLRLDAAELALLDAGDLALAFRLGGGAALMLHPPRPLARLAATAAAAESGFETPGLAAFFTPAAMAATRPALPSPERPFTTIEVGGATSALPATIRAALARTALPVECVATVQTDWPRALLAELEALAVQDRRFRLVAASASRAEGWVAEILAVPEGADWLAELHQEALPGGTVRRDDATLTWRAPGAADLKGGSPLR